MRRNHFCGVCACVSFPASKKRPRKAAAPTRAPATWRKNDAAKRARKENSLVRSTTFKYVDDGRALYKTKEQRLAEAAEEEEAAYVVKLLL